MIDRYCHFAIMIDRYFHIAIMIDRHVFITIMIDRHFHIATITTRHCIPSIIPDPFPYDHNAMHVIRHHDEFTEIHVWHVIRDLIPTPLCQFAEG
jgi:hypothetical protein